MSNISVYTIEAETLNQWAEEHDVTVAEIVEALVEAVKYGEIKLEEWV